MVYTPSGPFTPGGAPGISSSFLNNVEAFLASVNSAATDGNISAAGGFLTMLGLNVNPAAVVVNGTTGGTATLYQVLSGSVKLAFLAFSNYQNNTSTQQTISLPTPFNGQAYIFTGASPLLEPYRSGSLLGNATRVMTTLSNATGGGQIQIQNFIPPQSFGIFTSAPDAIGLGTSQSIAIGGIAFMIGN